MRVNSGIHRPYFGCHNHTMYSNIRLLDCINRPTALIDKAIELCLYCMKTQIYTDGNKRASVIFANHYLIAHGGGFLVIPEKEVPKFKKLLVSYYEGKGEPVIKKFLKEKCWRTF